MSALKAIDLFAGTGWGVACQRLGIDEYGVEIMPEAVKTREANGMDTWMNDVWDVLETELPEGEAYDVDLLIGSPPCQTFSLAGSGVGRKALDEVIELIDSGLYRDVKNLHAFGEAHDPRTALVLTPLTFAYKHRPRLMVLEQVPPVLPVWERYAVEMRKWGYSVYVGKVHAEQYGVPQTRTRAMLIARNDGIEATAPAPTHSKYYTRSPERLDEGVEKWVSMAEALGWLDDDGGIYFHPMSYGRRGIWPANEPAPTIRGVQRPMPETYQPHPRDAVLRSTYSTNGDYENRGERELDQPAPTVTTHIDRNTFIVANDKMANAAERHASQPAPTITGGHDSGNRVWTRHGAHSQQNGIHERPTSVPANTVTSDISGLGYIDESEVGERALKHFGVERTHFAGAGKTSEQTSGQRPRSLDEPAHTLTGKQTATWINGRTGEPINLDPTKPSTTVAGDPRLTSREHHFPGEQNSTSTRVTVQEASLLQSYPADFDWSTGINGKPLTKGKAFLQIGNAFPPLLAEVILAHMTGEQS